MFLREENVLCKDSESVFLSCKFSFIYLFNKYLLSDYFVPGLLSMGFSILCSPSYSRKEAKINRGNLKVITIIQIVINAIRQTCDT